jgi:transposase
MVGIISLDPGIRTFLTGYDPYRQNILHLGNNTNEILSKHSKTLDSLSKRIKYTKSRVKRRSYKKARK